MEEIENSKSNWLVSFFVVFFVPLVAFTPFLMMATAYGTLNPESWHRGDSALTLLTAFVFSLFSFAFYFVREKNINTNEYIDSVVCLKEFQEKKYIDYIMSHYGNVCSIAALAAIITLAFRESVKHIGIGIPAFAVSIGLMAIFLLYGLAFLKAVYGALNRRPLAFLALIAILALDVSVIKLAISSIPK